MVLFDRSWYNRAGVERVMGFCSDEEYEEFFRSVPEFERMLVRSGIQLIKYWFSITDEEQHFRFLSRIHDPLKQWKLSPMDLESRARWEKYTEAKEIMLERTHIPEAPGGSSRPTTRRPPGSQLHPPSAGRDPLRGGGASPWLICPPAFEIPTTCATRFRPRCSYRLFPLASIQRFQPPGGPVQYGRMHRHPGARSGRSRRITSAAKCAMKRAFSSARARSEPMSW
jgi:hypothetical protein